MQLNYALKVQLCTAVSGWLDIVSYRMQHNQFLLLQNVNPASCINLFFNHKELSSFAKQYKNVKLVAVGFFMV